MGRHVYPRTVQSGHHHHLIQINLSRHDIAEQLLSWRSKTITHSLTRFRFLSIAHGLSTFTVHPHIIHIFIPTLHNATEERGVKMNVLWLLNGNNS